jgi:SAM-dependent methyltransferase
VSEPTVEHDDADYDAIEDEFNDALSISLDPRGNEVLFDVIAALGLPPGASAVDVGCGRGEYSVELARRFGFVVHGVDPAQRYLGLAATLATEEPEVAARVSFGDGTAEAIPRDPETVDLILCREMLYLVDQLFNTDWLEPAEAERFWRGTANQENADRDRLGRCIDDAGLVVEEKIELGSETVEWAEEQSGKAARELRAAARLLRDPERYISQFGQWAYDIKLNDAFWFIYRMIGKLSQHVYVIRRPEE